MPIYLSASSIKDFLECSKRFEFRTTHKEQEIQNDDMTVGTIVHYAIEKFWNDELSATQEIEQQLKFFNLPATSVGKARTSLETFFLNFRGLLSDDDLIEYSFKLPLEKDVFLVGKIDRISNGNIFDWKTTTTPPTDISKDIQFIIYQEAYRRLFKKEPIATYYGSLTTGKLIKLKSNLALTNLLFYDIIPAMTTQVKEKLFYKKGMFTNSCHRCVYKELCFEESNYVVDSPKFAKK